MNIFYLDEDPFVCAERMCDQHITKMPLESAQILSTAHRVLDGNLVVGETKTGRKAKRWVLPEDDDKYYLAAYVNHPSTVWARQSSEHYTWLYEHFRALCLQFFERYQHHHSSWNRLKFSLAKLPQNIKDNGFVAPPQCMPDVYKHSNTIIAYNLYYASKFTDWCAKGRPMRWTKNGSVNTGSHLL